MTIRTVEALRAKKPLSLAEEQVLAELDSGKLIKLGDGTRPAADSPDRHLRAALIRLLMLQSDQAHSLHEQGLQVAGAWIPDPLDLEGCRDLRDLGLLNCHFKARPQFRSASLSNLFLNGSYLPGLSAVRLEAQGDVFLGSVTAIGTVFLFGAKLGGDLDCTEATFEATKDANGIFGDALAADGLEAQGNVSLRKATFTGKASLVRARLGGDLSCPDATFTATQDKRGTYGDAFSADGLEANGGVLLRNVTAAGAVGLPGANLGGNLSCTGARFEATRNGNGTVGYALNLEGAKISGAVFMRGLASFDGVLNLTSSKLERIVDDKNAWPEPGDLMLNWCTYGAFTSGPTDAKSRLDWLSRQDPVRWGDDFWPQPYEHLAKVLREMGHRDDARAVLIEKERRQRAARRTAEPQTWLRWCLVFWDTLLAWIVRYGHQPLWAFAWLLGAFLLGWSLFQIAAANGTIKPNNAFVLRSAEWVDCEPGRRLNPDQAKLRTQPQSQLACFLAQPEAASYPRFNSAIYSADTLLPIVNLEMQDYWIPDETNGGAWARRYLWLHIALGWALSLLAVAGFSGLVKSD